MASSCCRCSEDPRNTECRTQITSADLADLLYVQGLDVNLCEKFMPIAEALQLRDCAGNVIAADTQIVTCATFASRLCTALAALASGGTVTFGVTEVVGADCQVYTIPETPIIVVDTTTVDLTAVGQYNHTLSAVVKVSADAGNILVVHADGLYVPAAISACDQIANLPTGAVATPLITKLLGDDCQFHTIPLQTVTVNVSDTATVDMHIVGAPGSQVISADVIISPDAGNDLEAHPNGLYVDVCDSLAATTNGGVAEYGVTQLVGRDCKYYTLEEASLTTVVPSDTSCINMMVNEAPTGTFTVSAVPVISPVGDNQITCTPQGLYVQSVTVVPGDTSCVNMMVNEAPENTFTISAEPKLSPAEGNALVCTDQGLYVTGDPLLVPVTITVVDTDCIDFTLTNPVANSYELTADIIIDPAADNQVSCEVTGLYVPQGAGTVIGVVDTNCLNLTVTEPTPGTFSLTGNPIVSVTAGNILSCTGNGLYVPTPATGAGVTINGVDSNCIDMTVAQPVTGTFNISASPIIANAATGFPGGCNGLVCQADGLAVEPPQETVTYYIATALPILENETFTNGSSASGDLHVVTVTNPSTCRSAICDIYVRLGGIATDGVTNDPIRLAQTLYTSRTFPSAPEIWGQVNGQTLIANGQSVPSTPHIVRFTMAPGETGDFSAQIFLDQIFGDADVIIAFDMTVNIVITTI